MSTNTLNVVVVGGGVSGLSTAFQLEQLAEEKGTNLSVTLLEKQGTFGGRISTLQKQGYCVEEGANGFLNSKPSTLNLCEQLGLTESLLPANLSAKKRFIFLENKLKKLPGGPLEFLGSDLLSFRGKLRILKERWVPPRTESGEESIFEFGRRRIGQEAATKLLDAVVTGIHAGDSKLISLQAAFPRMDEFEKKHGGLFKALAQISREKKRKAREEGKKNKKSGTVGGPSGTLTSFRGGMSVLIDTLVSKLSGKRLEGVAVERVEPMGDGKWKVFTEHHSPLVVDAVVLAAPAYRQSTMVEGFDPDLAHVLSTIPYAKAAVVALGFRNEELKQVPNGYGYIAPQHTARDLLGVLWSSSIFENRSPQGEFLLRAICGGWNRPDVVNWDDEELTRAICKELELSMDISAKPVFSHIKRWENAIPQYHIGHLDKLARIEERQNQHPGLFFTGNAFRGISTNECTQDSVNCAKNVFNYLFHSQANTKE